MHKSWSEPECPAGTTASLVLYIAHNSFWTPIYLQVQQHFKHELTARCQRRRCICLIICKYFPQEKLTPTYLLWHFNVRQNMLPLCSWTILFTSHQISVAKFLKCEIRKFCGTKQHGYWENSELAFFEVSVREPSKEERRKSLRIHESLEKLYSLRYSILLIGKHSLL